MEAGLNYLFAELGIHNTAILAGILKVMWNMKVDYNTHMAKCDGKFNVIDAKMSEVKKDVSENTKQIKIVENKHNSLVLEIKEKWGKNGSSQEVRKETKKNRKENSDRRN